MAKKQKQEESVSQFDLDGNQRDHIRALAHRGDDKALCDFVEALVREVLSAKAD